MAFVAVATAGEARVSWVLESTRRTTYVSAPIVMRSPRPRLLVSHVVPPLPVTVVEPTAEMVTLVVAPSGSLVP